MFRLIRRSTLGLADWGRGSAVFLSVTLAAYLALGPLRLYVQNQYYYNVDLSIVALGAAGLFLLLALLLAGGLSALGQSARRVTMGGLFGLLVTLFVFDNILFFAVPELDGWTQAVTSPFLFVLDAVVAGILIAVALATSLFSYWPFMARALSFIVLFSVLQIVANAVSPSTAGLSESDVERSLAGKFKEVVLSPDRNVVHVIFDTFQGTEFEAALEKTGGGQDLRGFVWFKDSIGVHSSTSLSLPSIFTGKIYTEETMRDYYGGGDRTFLDALAENRFEPTLFTALPIPSSERIEKHHAFALLDRSPPVAGELGRLLDLFFIRASPFLAKDFFLNDYNFRLGSAYDRDFAIGNDRYRRVFIDFTNSLAVAAKPSIKPQYYFLHLIYPHPPYSHNEDCSAVGAVVPRSKEQAQIETVCALGDFTVFLERLRELGVYDETMIIMHGDTGNEDLGVAELQTSSLPHSIKNGMPFPVLLVKDFGVQGDMTVSQKPASIQDVPNTIMGALDLEPEFSGYDLLSATDLSSRVRQYRSWRVQPNALAGPSWSRIRRQAAIDERPKAKPLRPGDVISFRGDGLGHLYRRGKGFSTTSAHGTWALYPAADLVLPLDRDSADDISRLTFRVRLGGSLDPAERGRRAKRVRYALNGGAPRPIDFEFMTDRLATFEIPISEDASSTQATLSFLFEEPLNDQISDRRPLGFLIETMKVD